MILYIENPKDTTRKPQGQSMNLVKLQDTILMHRNLLHSHTLTMKNQKEKLRKQFHSPLQQKSKLVIHLPKETKDLYTENCKTLMKEIKDDTNRWRDIPCCWIGRINIMKMTVLLKAIQIHCNLYQNANGIFHRTKTKNFTSYMETQKTPNCQSNLTKGKWS